MWHCIDIPVATLAQARAQRLTFKRELQRTWLYILKKGANWLNTGPMQRASSHPLPPAAVDDDDWAVDDWDEVVAPPRIPVSAAAPAFTVPAAVELVVVVLGLGFVAQPAGRPSPTSHSFSSNMRCSGCSTCNARALMGACEGSTKRMMIGMERQHRQRRRHSETQYDTINSNTPL